MTRLALMVAVMLVLVLVVAGGVGWVVTLDPNQHKATIERWASDALGDVVRIEGPIALTRGLTPTLVVNDLRVSKTTDADPSVSIQRAELSVVLTSLLWGPLHLPHIAVATAELELPLQGGGSASGAGDGRLPRIDQLTLADIKVHYRRDDGSVLDFTIEHAAVAPAADGSTTALEMTGTVAALPLKITGTTGAIPALFASEQGLPIRIETTLADGELGLSGNLSLAGGKLAYQLDAKLDLPAASKLAGGFGLPLPAVAATAKLRAKDGAVAAKALSATLGTSDVAGDLTWQGGGRGALSGSLSAKRIDLLELGLIRLGGDEAKPNDTDHLLPDLVLVTPAQVPIDLDLEATIEQLDLPGATITAVAATAKGNERKLDLSVTEAKLGGGVVRGRYQSGGGEPPDVAFTFDATTVDLASLVARPKDGSKLPQDVNVKIDLAGQGADLRAFLASAKGSIAIDTGAAEFESEFADLLGQSLFTAMIPGLNASGHGHMICSVLDLEAKDGKARSTALVIDGKHAVIGGGGAIDLATGTIDFMLLPTAKNATLAPLVTPVHVAGTITDPKLVGDATTILSSTSHLLLGIVNPLSLATPVLHPDRKGGVPCLDPSVLDRSGPIQRVGGTAVDAVKDTAKGVGSAIEQIGEGVGKLLEGITGQ